MNILKEIAKEFFTNGDTNSHLRGRGVIVIQGLPAAGKTRLHWHENCIA